MSNSRIILSFLFLLFFVSCKTQKKAVVNNAEIVQDAEKEKVTYPVINSIRSNYILNDSSKVTVFLKLDVLNLPKEQGIEALNELFKTSWFIQPDFGIREKLKSGKITFSNENTFLKNDIYYVQFEVPRLTEYSSGILVLEFADYKASRKFTNDIYVDFSGARISDRFGLYIGDNKFPSFEPTVSLEEKVVFKSLNGGTRKMFLKELDMGQKPALSPMSTSKREELEGLKVLSVREIKENEEIRFSAEGHFCISDDSSGIANSLGFMVKNKYYPRLVNESELAGPLVYMSTNTETSSFKTEEGMKDALDLYFLGLTNGNQVQSKQIIRSFYRRVAKVNELFSTYKEGWRTDQGMVYLILGAPSSIQKSGRREVWLYNQRQSLNPIYFTFYRKPNELSASNYELVRYPEYSALWYPFVEAWRTGSVLE